MATGASNPSPEQPQNIYDRPDFFAGYSQMERFGTGWRKALEQPLFLSLLPSLNGLRALDLGCGAGQLSLHLAEAGASEVVAVDVSATMLELARAERCHARVEYRQAPIEDLEFEPRRFELVVSSLAFHYVADYARLIRDISTWLTPGGALVFSTEHPIYTARLPGEGWLADGSGWRIDNYFVEGERDETWFVSGVRKYHRTVATLIDTLLSSGMRVERVIEPAPDAARLRDRPRDAEELRRPMFILIRATRV